MQQPQQPTKQDFEEFRKSIKGLWKGSDISAAVNQRWTADKDRIAFYEWMQVKETRSSAKASPAIPAKDLLCLVNTTNFNIKSDREAVARAVKTLQYGSLSEYLPVGREDNGEIYRLLRRTDALTTQSTIPVSRELLPSYILGVNTNLPSKLTHEKENSGESVLSNETDDLLIGGFTFFQVGKLERFCGMDASDPGQHHAWEDTGFGVVVRLTPSGSAAGVYIIFDFYPEYPELGDRTRKTRSSDDVIWGWLPNSEISAMQFSCAMIADRITDLSATYKLRFSDYERHQVEIVRAVLGSNNTIIRATIPPNQPPPTTSPNKRGRQASSESSQLPGKKVAY